MTISCIRIVKVQKIHLTFRYCSHKSPMVKQAKPAEILNPDITNGGPPPCDAGKAGLYILREREREGQRKYTEFEKA